MSAKILAFYICLIALWPCADLIAQNHCGQEKHIYPIEETHHAPVSHNDFSDHCSPLCVCHCCHVHTIVHSANQTLASQFMTEATSRYVFQFPKDLISGLWRPPSV